LLAIPPFHIQESAMATDDGISDVLTNLVKPKTDATLTLRIIKSFKFRTEKSLVLHGVNLDTTTVGDLKTMAKQGVMASLLRARPAIMASTSRS
jgi:hypothetical protein